MVEVLTIASITAVKSSETYRWRMHGTPRQSASWGHPHYVMLSLIAHALKLKPRVNLRVVEPLSEQR